MAEKEKYFSSSFIFSQHRLPNFLKHKSEEVGVFSDNIYETEKSKTFLVVSLSMNPHNLHVSWLVGRSVTI